MAQFNIKPSRQLGIDGPSAENTHSSVLHPPTTVPAVDGSMLREQLAVSEPAGSRRINNITQVFGEHQITTKPKITALQKAYYFALRQKRKFEKSFVEDNSVGVVKPTYVKREDITLLPSMSGLDQPYAPSPVPTRFGVLIDEMDSVTTDSEMTSDMQQDDVEATFADESVEVKNKTPKEVKVAFDVTSEVKTMDEVYDSFDVLDALTEIPDKEKTRKLVSKQSVVRSHRKLTNFLKSKHFMKARTIPLINTMVTDARVWLLQNGRKCDTDEDYLIMTSSVMAAYMVQEEELAFREFLRNAKNHRNTRDLNSLISDGVLGHIGITDQMKYSESLINKALPVLKMPSSGGMQF